jgi:hypothetical protein
MLLRQRENEMLENDGSRFRTHSSVILRPPFGRTISRDIANLIAVADSSTRILLEEAALQLKPEHPARSFGQQMASG